ncbi:MAG: transcriptional regulator [Rhodospirillales bacterium]|jgi:predicted transcriptional regulator|nr:transcriptional regulator [Rhodospirillales bacterium]
MSDKSTPSNHGEILRMVTDVIASYLKKNPVAANDLPGVISTVYGAFMAPQTGPVEAVVERPEPAVPIKRSITPDFIICLEDGKQLKMLKRHLATSYNLTPDEYRARWGLPPDYPMVAPNYATQRSALAKQIGLGSRSRDGKPTRGKAKTA